MDSIIFLILRRMRQPLLTLVVVYAVTVLGLTLIPGQDAEGNPARMSIFHALYFVSFMSTTIGFGEIPYPFTDAQRLWVTISMYANVIVWIYALGTILTLVQDKRFQEAIGERRFSQRVRRRREPFYLVCGYGETGSALVQTLTDRGQHAVVMDINDDRIHMLSLQNLPDAVPALHGDARKPELLLEAGLSHPQCAGVVAVTNFSDVNLKVAITSRLLHPDIPVICRADSHDVERNMASFGTNYIVDPYDTFALHLSTALQSPCLYLLERWLTGVENTALVDPIYPPKEGVWIVCGYGRFGKAVCKRLHEEGIQVVVIEATPDLTGTPPGGQLVLGRGTEADTLLGAGVDKAVGLVAGTDDDANNLSIIMTARELNPKLFVIARQNHRDNQEIVDAVGADMVMHASTIIADKIRVLLATPVLYDFINLAVYQDDSWACELSSRIVALVQDTVPMIHELVIEPEGFCAVASELAKGQHISLGHILRDPAERERRLDCIALLLERSGRRFLLPEDDLPLKMGDKILFCGKPSAFTKMSWTLCYDYHLYYVQTGKHRPVSWAWRRVLSHLFPGRGSR